MFCFWLLCLSQAVLAGRWVDQHGYSTRRVPQQMWDKAVRYTGWAQESLSSPVGVDDLLVAMVFRLFLLRSLRWRKTMLRRRKMMRSHNVLFWDSLVFCFVLFLLPLFAFIAALLFVLVTALLRSWLHSSTAKSYCSRRHLFSWSGCDLVRMCFFFFDC